MQWTPFATFTVIIRWAFLLALTGALYMMMCYCNTVVLYISSGHFFRFSALMLFYIVFLFIGSEFLWSPYLPLLQLLPSFATSTTWSNPATWDIFAFDAIDTKRVIQCNWFHNSCWFMLIDADRIYPKSGCPGCPDSAENSNFPQKDCLRTQKLSVAIPES